MLQAQTLLVVLATELVSVSITEPADVTTLANLLACEGAWVGAIWNGNVSIPHGVTLAEGSRLSVTGSALGDAGGAVIDGGDLFRLFELGPNSILVLTNIQLSRGFVMDGNGGAVLAVGAGARVSCNFGCLMTRNHAEKLGGAVSVEDGAEFLCSAGCVISRNIAGRAGSGFAVSGTSSSATISGALQESASEGGGREGHAAYATDGATIVLEGDALVTQNSNGALFASFGSTLIMKDQATVFDNHEGFSNVEVTESSSLLMQDSSSVRNNSAVTESGGVTVYTSSTITMRDDSSITGNYMMDRGGGMWLSGEAFLQGRATISDNEAGTSGGGIALHGWYATLYMTDDSRVSHNHAGEGGGGIQVSSGASILLSGRASVRSNVSKLFGGGIMAFDLSALHLLDESAVHSNTAIIGAGVALTEFASLDMQGNASIHSNSAIDAGGGIFAETKCTMIFSEFASVTKNEAAVRGGGVYLAGQSQLTMTGYSAIDGNNATGDGGGVHAYSGAKLELSEWASIVRNGANGRGGGLFITGAYASFDDESFLSENQAMEEGGGVAVMAGSTALFWGSVAVEGNSALSGGGVYLGDGFAETRGNILFRNNFATLGGGAIMATASANASVGGSTAFLSNGVKRAGGAILYDGNGIHISPGVTFVENVASCCAPSLSVLAPFGSTCADVNEIEGAANSVYGDYICCVVGEYAASNGDCIKCEYGVSGIDCLAPASRELGADVLSLSLEPGFWRASLDTLNLRSCTSGALQPARKWAVALRADLNPMLKCCRRVCGGSR
jgi:predicted outer membrane repeat protein